VTVIDSSPCSSSNDSEFDGRPSTSGSNVVGIATLRQHSLSLAGLLLALATTASARVITEVLDAAGAGGTPLTSPVDVAVDSQGTLYVDSAHPTSAVFRVPQGGPPTVFVDASGDGAGSVLATPSRLAIDADDNLYVVASGSDNVIDIPVADTGQCGEAMFPATPPAKPSCAVVSGGKTVRCK
jgi:hypothetical protein